MKLAEPLEVWERQRREFVREHVVFTYVGCLLVLFAAVVAFFRVTVETYFDTYWVLYVILSVSVLGLVLGEVSRRFVVGATADPRVGSAEFWLLAGCLALVGGLVYLTGGYASSYKALVVVPVIVSAVTYGKGAAFLVTLLCGGALVALDLFQAPPGGHQQYLGADLVLGGVLVLAGWLVGGLAEMERRVRRRMEEMSALDPLTGLLNHGRFFDLLWRAEEEAARRGTPLALVLLDLDDFRRYNEIFGYSEGDAVLRRVGDLVRRYTPEAGFAARFGGEEFALALPGADAGRAAALAEELRAAVAACRFFGDEAHPGGRLTVSAGVAVFPEHTGQPGELLKLAGEALQRAKFLKKNRVNLYASVGRELGGAATDEQRLQAIRVLLTIINAKDNYTYGHSQRVARWADRLAEGLGLGHEERIWLHYGAFLHDIGKIELDHHILNKPARLTEEEWALVRRHPVWGSEIIRGIEELRPVVPVVLFHHENYDGTGYPEGRKGDDIPLLARILRIVDSFDAITTARPYRRARTVEEAVAELRRGAGSLYDPRLVEEFVRVLRLEDFT